MKKSLPLFLLFFLLLTLVSCTISKRRYTGGYSVNWHSKAPDIRTIASAQTKLSEINYHTENFIAAPQTENAVSKKMVETITTFPKTITKNIANYHPTPYTYTVTPENSVPGHNAPAKNDNSDANIAPAIIFWLIGSIWGLIAALIIAVAPLLTGTAITSSAALGYAIFPILLLIASLYFCDMAMKNGHNFGLIICMILATLLLIGLVAAVASA